MLPRRNAPPLVFRFYEAFIAYEHGDPEALSKMENMWLDAL
jgi:hypothetical protein